MSRSTVAPQSGKETFAQIRRQASHNMGDVLSGEAEMPSGSVNRPVKSERGCKDTPDPTPFNRLWPTGSFGRGTSTQQLDYVT